MSDNIEYSSDEDILIRTFKGTITMKDVISSWVYVIETGLISQYHKGIISDYREANIQIEIDDVEKLMLFFKKHEDIFKNLKLAVVIDSPNIAIPMYLTHKYPKIAAEPFSSIEAAIRGIRPVSVI